MKYNLNKHHPPEYGARRTSRHSIRLKGYDYSSCGGYFITICVRNRECLLGKVVDLEMHVNEFGKIVEECWEEIPKRYPNVETDEFVVMPDHVHGIIIIKETAINVGDSVAAIHVGVGAIHELPRPRRTDDMIHRRRMLLPKIVGRFKMNSAKRINELMDSRGESVWQRNYYEHIIRDEGELNRIRKYIHNNPARWLHNKKTV